MATNRKIRVGIVGASPSRGFASIAHIPALHALPDFEISAVCGSGSCSPRPIAIRRPDSNSSWCSGLRRPQAGLAHVLITQQLISRSSLVVN
jgi:hypothetical protein